MMEWWVIQDIYRTRGQAAAKIYTTPPPIQQIQDEFRLAPGLPIGQFVYALQNYNPNTLSSAHYLRRNPYYHPVAMDRLLGDYAASGLLDYTGQSDPFEAAYVEGYSATAARYCVNDKGRRLYARVDDLLRPRWMLPAVEGADLNRILALMRRVAEATQNAPTPPDRWVSDTRRQYGIKTPDDAPPMQRLNGFTFDLWAYRDDVHLASWQTVHRDISPRAWEAFTLLWRKEADSAETLAKELQAERAFTAADYQQALDELVKRGWAKSVPDSDKYTLTETGTAARQESEDATDRWFYRPWDIALNAEERAELRRLLERLRDQIAALIAA